MRSSLSPTALAVAVALAAAPSPAPAQTLTLRDALAGAFSTHPMVGTAEARVAGAEAAVSQANAARLPAVGTTASLTRYQEPMLVAPLHAFDPTNIPDFDRTLVQAQAGLQYTVFEGGLRGARSRGAEAMAGAARWDAQATEADLIEMVTEAYLAVLSTQAVEAAANRQVAALGAERDRAQREFTEGTAPRVEVMRADAALLDARAGGTSASAGVEVALKNLARVMGATPTELAPMHLTPVELSPVIDTDARAHPVVEGRRGEVWGARARADQERASRLPTVAATAGLLDFGTLDGGHIAEWQAGIRVSWAIFTGGARSASIRRADADVRNAEERLRLTELQIAAAEDAARAALSEAESRAEALGAAVGQWEEVARIEALRVEEGAGVQSDLLRAEAALFRARAGFARATYDAVLARVRLAKATGQLDRAWMEKALEATP